MAIDRTPCSVTGCDRPRSHKLPTCPLHSDPASPPRFPLGHLRVTPGAQQAMEEAGDPSESFLRRHVQGDWGDIDADDCATNEDALRDGSELMSAYRTRLGVKLWVIAEADRRSTTILLPEEY